MSLVLEGLETPALTLFQQFRPLVESSIGGEYFEPMCTNIPFYNKRNF